LRGDRRARQARRTAKACAGLLVLVAVFETLRLLAILPSQDVPSTVDIARALVSSVADGELPSALGSTITAWLLGVALAAVIAVPLGVAVGRSRWADSTTRVAVEFLRPIPVVALVPVAIVLFGLEPAMQVFLVALACIWPVMLGTRHGVRAVDPLQLDTARTFGLSGSSVMRRVVLPASLPSIVTALRVGASLGVVVAIAAEIVSGSPGLGKLLIDNQQAGNNGVVYACLVVAGVFGVVVNLALARGERVLAGWQEATTEALR